MCPEAGGREQYDMELHARGPLPRRNRNQWNVVRAASYLTGPAAGGRSAQKRLQRRLRTKPITRGAAAASATAAAAATSGSGVEKGEGAERSTVTPARTTSAAASRKTPKTSARSCRCSGKFARGVWSCCCAALRAGRRRQARRARMWSSIYLGRIGCGRGWRRPPPTSSARAGVAAGRPCSCLAAKIGRASTRPKNAGVERGEDAAQRPGAVLAT